MSRLSRSFCYAATGIWRCIKEQANMRLHVIITIVVIAAGFFSRLEPWEWSAISITIAMVWVAELINTAIEKTVDLVTRDFHPLAGLAKDIAAGAVLLTAINAIIIGAIVFVPRLLRAVL